MHLTVMCLIFLQVRTFKMNLFTVIQIIIVALLCFVQSTIAALIFPFLLVILIPFRLFILRFVFTNEELKHVSVFYL